MAQEPALRSWAYCLAVKVGANVLIFTEHPSASHLSYRSVLVPIAGVLAMYLIATKVLPRLSAAGA